MINGTISRNVIFYAKVFISSTNLHARYNELSDHPSKARSYYDFIESFMTDEFCVSMNFSMLCTDLGVVSVFHVMSIFSFEMSVQSNFTDFRLIPRKNIILIEALSKEK